MTFGQHMAYASQFVGLQDAALHELARIRCNDNTTCCAWIFTGTKRMTSDAFLLPKAGMTNLSI